MEFRPRSWFHIRIPYAGIFLISGLLFHYSDQKKPFWRFIAGKVRSLLTPCLFFEAFAQVVQISLHGTTLNIKGLIWEMLVSHLVNGPLWFLVVLFLSEMLFFWAVKLMGIFPKSGYVLMAVLFVLLLFFPKFQAYINITTTVMALFFLLAGYLFEGFFEKGSVLLTTVMFAVTVLISHINKGVGIPDYQDGNRILFIIGALTGCYFVMRVGKSLAESKALNYYGKNSIVIVGTHYPIMRLVKFLAGIDEFTVLSGSAFLAAL